MNFATREIGFSRLQRVTAVCRSRVQMYSDRSKMKQKKTTETKAGRQEENKNLGSRIKKSTSCNYTLNRSPVYYNMSVKGITNQCLYAKYNSFFSN